MTDQTQSPAPVQTIEQKGQPQAYICWFLDQTEVHDFQELPNPEMPEYVLKAHAPPESAA